MKRTICISCHQELIYYYCQEAIILPTPESNSVTQRHVINIRVQLGAHLSGISRVSLQKLCASLQISPPIAEEYYRKIDHFPLNVVRIHQQKLIDLVIQEGHSSN